MPVFVGIDLAWQSNKNPSGAAVLIGDHTAVELQTVAVPLRSLSEVGAFLGSVDTNQCVVAIDGPLVINNAEGMRSCEREVGRAYGGRHASCHASNLKLYPDPLSVRLANDLIDRGYRHPNGESVDKVVLEVYPHAGFVALFNLPRIISYKKGRVSQKVQGLRTVQDAIRSLGQEEAPLRTTDELAAFLGRDPAEFRGAARKEYEDGLDALFCSYLAYYFWRWGFDRSEMFGNVAEGYIVNPKLRTEYKRPAAT